MDESAVDISFDGEGICDYCRAFLEDSAHVLKKLPEDRLRERDRLVRTLKSQGRNAPYDCIVGVSGGLDSSWALVCAVEQGLRPLAVHMDNGWNSELAQNNIANLVRDLGVDLYTHVIDWEEYRSLMSAFFVADVIDVELLYDNAMLAVNYQQAARHGVKYILAGTNQATEGMRIPPDWVWFKFDRKNIKEIARRFGGVRFRSFPSIGTWQYFWYSRIRRIRWVSFLDYFDYDRAAVVAELRTNYGYKPYPYKHYESVFTRFYQGYILPRKFGVDKRRLHLSTLIAAGQMTRTEALEDLEGEAYPSLAAMQEDRLYFVKKMGWSESDLDAYLARPKTPHNTYASEKGLWIRLFGALHVLASIVKRVQSVLAPKLDDAGLLYIAAYDRKQSPGIHNKVVGTLEAAKRLGYRTRIAGDIACLRLRDAVRLLVFCGEKQVFIRSFTESNIFLMLFMALARLQGKILTVDVPTPSRVALREILSQKETSLLERLYRVALLVAGGPYSLWPASRILQYAGESFWFSLGNGSRTLKVGNGINVESVPARISAPPWPCKNLKLLAVATLTYWHGYDRAIRAIAQWASNPGRPYEVKLTLVGDGRASGELRNLAQGLGVEHLVTFVGQQHRDAIGEYYADAHLALGSLGLHRKGLSEASELKAREYCAVGIPFIASGRDADFPAEVPFRIVVDCSDDTAPLLDVFARFGRIREQFSDADIRSYAEKNLTFLSKLEALGLSSVR